MIRRSGLADLDEFAAFEHAQQLGLQFDGHFSDFVEKQRSLVGLFEQPLFVLRRTRETAGAVAEEFAFEQLFGEGRAVDRHECLSGARPGLVDRLREDLLARSGLAGEQYRRVRRSDFAREVHGLSERLRRTDDAVERMFVGEFRLETRQSALHPRLLRRMAQQRQDLVVVVAFGDVVECAVLDRLHAVGYVAVGGEQDDFGSGCDLLDPADQFHAVAVGEFDVAQHDVGFVLAEQPEARGTVRSLLHVVSFQSDDARQQRTQLGFVVDNQNFRHCGSRSLRQKYDKIRNCRHAPAAAVAESCRPVVGCVSGRDCDAFLPVRPPRRISLRPIRTA